MSTTTTDQPQTIRADTIRADGRTMEYLTTLPRVAPGASWRPPHRILVHNNVRPTRELGARGFRAWLTSPDDDRYVICDCKWASELGDHYRVRGC